MLISSILKIVKYAAGVCCWLIIFAVLQQQCVFDIHSVVDRLWVKTLNDNLVKNIIGEIAFHVQAGRCVEKYIYMVRYDPGRTDREREVRTLTSLVDVATWTELREDSSVTSTYIDAKYRYTLYVTSDEEYIRVVHR